MTLLYRIFVLLTLGIGALFSFIKLSNFVMNLIVKLSLPSLLLMPLILVAQILTGVIIILIAASIARAALNKSVADTATEHEKPKN